MIDFVWVTGSIFGARSTFSPSLVKLTQDRVPWFVAVMVITGLLKVFGAVIGVSLTRPVAQPHDGVLRRFCWPGTAGCSSCRACWSKPEWWPSIQRCPTWPAGTSTCGGRGS
ncbi:MULTISPECIES: DUF3995 domain-containing protein [Amycolatopsis]|uniref:DUF3995 domain-containing protein n=1 Tax=Amycolatopsis TaxID=1813 RepID=UPI0018E3A67E|nr:MULTISPECIES: DUF3995 domain-containing protein [Amycolatopsis]